MLLLGPRRPMLTDGWCRHPERRRTGHRRNAADPSRLVALSMPVAEPRQRPSLDLLLAEDPRGSTPVFHRPTSGYCRRRSSMRSTAVRWSNSVSSATSRSDRARLAGCLASGHCCPRRARRSGRPRPGEQGPSGPSKRGPQGPPTASLCAASRCEKGSFFTAQRLGASWCTSFWSTPAQADLSQGQRARFASTASAPR